MRPTVVITSAVPWDGTTARPQHFARGLATRGWNVLFVNAPTTWLAPLKQRTAWTRLIPQHPVTEIANDGPGWIRVLSPVACLPFGNLYRVLNRWNQIVLAEQITAAAPGPYVLLPMLPGSVDLIPALHPIALCYDCVDLHSNFHGFINPKVVEEMESDLAMVSRSVFATAKALARRMEQWNPNVKLVPNAAEIAHFQKTGEAQVHPRIADLPEPRIALIGGFGTWVDQTFLKHLATHTPQAQFVMIGPIETDVSALAALPNVHFLGLQPYRELPQYLAGCQATLVSFVRNELTQSVNPIKVFEYLAADKEVVATWMPELEKMNEFIWLANTPEEGVDMLHRVLNGERRTDLLTRQAFVSEQSWDARVDVVHESLVASLPASWR